MMNKNSKIEDIKHHTKQISVCRKLTLNGNLAELSKERSSHAEPACTYYVIGLITVFDAILTSRQTRLEIRVFV